MSPLGLVLIIWVLVPILLICLNDFLFDISQKLPEPFGYIFIGFVYFVIIGFFVVTLIKSSKNKHRTKPLEEFKKELWIYLKENTSELSSAPIRKEELKAKVDTLVRRKLSETKVSISEEATLALIDSYLCYIPHLKSEYLDESGNFLPSISARHKKASPDIENTD